MNSLRELFNLAKEKAFFSLNKVKQKIIVEFKKKQGSKKQK